MTTVIEKPMLFSGPMVRAILEGRKTQTRRIVNLSRVSHPVNGMWFQRPEEAWVAADIDAGNFDPPECLGQTEIKCPHPVGSRIWVRETCATYDSGKAVVHKATVDASDWECLGALYKRRPAIHMPRWASRITLEVTDVRVQRLQEMTEADALDEGIHPPQDHYARSFFPRYYCEGFKLLWNSINGPGAWEQNPWVWAYTFRRLEGDHD